MFKKCCLIFCKQSDKVMSFYFATNYLLPFTHNSNNITVKKLQEKRKCFIYYYYDFKKFLSFQFSTIYSIFQFFGIIIIVVLQNCFSIIKTKQKKTFLFLSFFVGTYLRYFRKYKYT